MLARLAVLVVAMALSACSMIQVQPEASQFSVLRTATYQLKMGDFGTCSGTMIAPKHFLTAAHCVTEDGLNMSVNGLPATVAKKNEEKDLALLMVDIECPCVDVAAGDYPVDSKVAVVGYPLGFGQWLTEGRLMPPLTHPDLPSHYTGITAPIAPGNSGGGVFAFDGEQWVLVGVASAVASVGFGGFVPHIGLMVKTSVLVNFLTNGIEPMKTDGAGVV